MKILVSDFDGTFFDKNYLKNIERINKFVDEGNMFIIATGRSINALNKDIQDYKIKYSYLICSDGSSIYDNKHNNLYSCDIDSSLINPICEMLDNDSNIVITLIENDNFASGTRANSIAGKFIDRKKALKLVENINKNYTDVYSYLSEYHINIRNKKVSKYQAIKFLIDNYNLDQDVIYTIGDNINDLEMCENFRSFSFNHTCSEIKNISNQLVNNFLEALDILEKK